MKAPAFWMHNGFLATALAPASLITKLVTAKRLARPGFDPGIPVICAGNAGVGGAGKTILALDLLSRLPGRPFALTRGYRGRLQGPLLIDPARHSAADAGDEALLLAAASPTILARDRAAGARLAVAEGATCIVMDDGLQNPDLKKTISFLVIDGGYGFGNGKLLPAGPLREPVKTAAARCAATIMIGPDITNAAAMLPPGIPLLQASLAPSCAVSLAGLPVVAFAGIGRPAKFFASVAELGAAQIHAMPFPDHHIYTPKDVQYLRAIARAQNAKLVTTAKDFVKLPASLRAEAIIVVVALQWADEMQLAGLLADAIAPRWKIPF